MKLILLVTLLAGCGDITPYYCDMDSDCETDSGVMGKCIIGVNDYEVCAYADNTCPAPELRYDQSAGNLARLCVGEEGNLEP